MEKDELIAVRIYGEKHGDLWILVSLDFGLGTQAQTLSEAIYRIDEQIKDYLYDACLGSNKYFKYQLLNRKASFKFFIKYYWALFSQMLHKLRRSSSTVAIRKPFSVYS